MHEGIQKVLDAFPAIKVPRDFSVLRTRWGSDALHRGSYSYVSACSSPADVETLSQPLVRPPAPWCTYCDSAGSHLCRHCSGLCRTRKSAKCRPLCRKAGFPCSADATPLLVLSRKSEMQMVWRDQLFYLLGRPHTCITLELCMALASLESERPRG